MTSVWILSKRGLEEYENARLVSSFTEAGIETLLVHPDHFDLVVDKKDLTNVWLYSKKTTLPDAVLVRTGSGSNYFSLAVMRQLESLGIPVINTPYSIGLVKDKLETGQILASNNLPIPKTMLVRFPINKELVKSEIGFPCVIKLGTGSHGAGVYLCEHEKDFGPLMELISSLNANKTTLIQEYIGYKFGTDLRVLVVGGKVIGVMQRSSVNGDFRANISAGGVGESHPITAEIERISIHTAKVVGLDIAGVDLLFDSDGSFKVLEVNSAPGFIGADQFIGIDMAKHIVDYVKFRAL